MNVTLQQILTLDMESSNFQTRFQSLNTILENSNAAVENKLKVISEFEKENIFQYIETHKADTDAHKTFKIQETVLEILKEFLLLNEGRIAAFNTDALQQETLTLSDKNKTYSFESIAGYLQSIKQVYTTIKTNEIDLKDPAFKKFAANVEYLQKVVNRFCFL